IEIVFTCKRPVEAIEVLLIGREVKIHRDSIGNLSRYIAAQIVFPMIDAFVRTLLAAVAEQGIICDFIGTSGNTKRLAVTGGVSPDHIVNIVASVLEITELFFAVW